MRSTLNVLFFIKATVQDKEKKSPIMGRITIDGVRAQFNTKCKIKPEEWDSKNNKVKGRSNTAIEINGLLDSIKANITKHYWEIYNFEGGQFVTAEKVKNAFLGLNQRKETLLSLFDDFLKDLDEQVKKGEAKLDTFQKYERTHKRLKEFMQYKYNVSDIALREITAPFLKNFEVYLKTMYSLSQNTTVKFMDRVKTIYLIALGYGWVKINPFAFYKIQEDKVERDFLTDGEIDKILHKKFASKRLEKVRDLFIFSCFTDVA